MLEYLKNKAQRDAFIDKYDNFLFDCDGKNLIICTMKRISDMIIGVLWEGTHMFKGVPEAMSILREKGISVFIFFTINALYSHYS